MFSKVNEYLDSLLGDKNVMRGYDCLVYHKGKEVHRHMNGYSDIEKEIPINGKERTFMYSASKPVTCAAALQLWERGLFSLEDDLCKYMPEFTEMTVMTPDGIKPAQNKIKVKDLFMMSAGFTYALNSPSLRLGKAETNGRAPTREMMKYLAKEPLAFEPGTACLYSLCHDVLAAFVEVVSGMRFGEYVKKNIFDPMGMNDSTFLLPDEELDTISTLYVCNMATGEISKWDKVIALPQMTLMNPNTYFYEEKNYIKLGSEYESGGGGLISTVDDYMKFLEGVRTFKLLKEETVRAWSTNQLTDEQMASFDVNFSYFNGEYAYGLGVRCPRAGTDRTDFGWMGAAASYLAIDLENEISVFFGEHVVASPIQYTVMEIIQYVKEALGV